VSFFTIGPIVVHYYALCLLTGIILAVCLTSVRLKRRGIKPGVALDFAIWAVPIGIIGGRLYHVVTHPHDYFYPGANLWVIPAVWDGGLAIFGSILFGCIGIYIGCRRAGIRFLTFADALIPGVLLAQAFGRFGNYFNQELFGPPTTLPWGVADQLQRTSVPGGNIGGNAVPATVPLRNDLEHARSPRADLRPRETLHDALGPCPRFLHDLVPPGSRLP
jgi:prolipoprotein diacylglyceryl transferase